MSLVAQVAAVMVLVWPEHESEIVEAGRSTGALLVLLLSALGYVRAEASIDREQAGGGDSP